MTGKGINRGGGYGLEVPCKYRISGREKAVDWLKRKAITFLQERSLTVNKCLEKKYNKKKFLCVHFVAGTYGEHTIMVQMFLWDLKKVSALRRARFRVSALERFCYKRFLRNSSGTKFFICLREMSTLEDSCFREVSLYFKII